jgi:IS5 family transposase
MGSDEHLRTHSRNLHLDALLNELDDFLTLAAVAIDQCEHRVLNGEKVPRSEKIVSIFEDHTDIICCYNPC